MIFSKPHSAMRSLRSHHSILAFTSVNQKLPKHILTYFPVPWHKTLFHSTVFLSLDAPKTGEKQYTYLEKHSTANQAAAAQGNRRTYRVLVVSSPLQSMRIFKEVPINIFIIPQFSTAICPFSDDEPTNPAIRTNGWFGTGKAQLGFASGNFFEPLRRRS